MSTNKSRGSFLIVAAVIANLLLSSTARAQYIVNSTADGVDVSPGDGLCLTAAGTCTLRAAIMDGNASPGPNGATLPPGTYRLTISGPNEDASASGDLDITDNFIIEGDRAAVSVIDGGGLDRVIDLRSGGLTLRRVQIRNGSAAEGGGIRAAGLLIVEESIVRSNVVTGNGGGLLTSSSVQIVRSTFAQNRAGVQGGGIFLNLGAGGGQYSMTDSTISSNFATVSGGGLAIASTSGAAVSVTHATFQVNAAPSGSSLLANASAGIAIRNSILSAGADNCAGPGTITDQGGNVASVACGSIPGNPALDGTIEPLALYHPPFAPGPMLGHGLTPTSPAVGAALLTFCSPVDQRGIARPIGGTCDSGAFELSVPNGPYDPTLGDVTLTPIADRVIRTGTGTVTVRVSASNALGAVDRLELSASSSNEAVVPSSGIRVTRISDNTWDVRVLAAANRTGIAVVALSAVGFNPDERAVSRFAVTARGQDGEAGGGTQAAANGPGPANVTATPSGSGFVLSWSPSTATDVRQYAVSGVTASGASMPVLLTAGTETTMTLPSLPAGTYAFRVSAIGANGVSAPSPDTIVTSANAEAPGTPYGVIATPIPGGVQVTGRLPQFGAPATSFAVEFGSTPGSANVASVAPTSAPFVQGLTNGFYWVQARALRGAFVGVPTSSFGVLVGSQNPACIEEPHAPILLPPAINAGTLTVAWLRALSGPGVRTFQLERLSGPNGVPVELFAPQTHQVHVADLAPGTYSYRVSAENACGQGAHSNSVTVTIP